MPRSKHRRKPGGKAVRHPGRHKGAGSRLRREQYIPPPEWDAMDQVHSAYLAEVRQAFPEDPDGDAAFVAETILEQAFEFRDGAGHLQPVDRSWLVAECCRGSPDDIFPPLSPERVEAIVAHLITQQLAEAQEMQITIPERFLAGSPEAAQETSTAC